MFKKINFLIVAAILCGTLSSYAQEKTGRFPNYGNWFVEASGGINSVFNNRKLGEYGPAASLGLGKWLAPDAGVRLGLNGVKNGAPVDDDRWMYGKGSFLHFSVTGDLIWRPIDTFAGYDASRVYSLQPYARFSFLFTGADRPNNLEFGAGGGLRNVVKLGERISLVVDLAAVITREHAYRIAGQQAMGRFLAFPTLSAGFSINLGKQGFKKTVEIIREVPVEKIVEKIVEVPVEKIVEVEKAVKAEDPLSVGSIIVLFDIGKADLTLVERAQVEAFVKGLDVKNTKFIVTGQADKATGNADGNLELSKQRAQVVYDVLTGYCGVPAEHVSVKAIGDTANLGTPEVNRSVTVSAFKR